MEKQISPVIWNGRGTGNALFASCFKLFYCYCRMPIKMYTFLVRYVTMLPYIQTVKPTDKQTEEKVCILSGAQMRNIVCRILAHKNYFEMVKPCTSIGEILNSIYCISNSRERTNFISSAQQVRWFPTSVRRDCKYISSCYGISCNETC